jgi:hypothetical protein
MYLHSLEDRLPAGVKYHANHPIKRSGEPALLIIHLSQNPKPITKLNSARKGLKKFYNRRRRCIVEVG